MVDERFTCPFCSTFVISISDQSAAVMETVIKRHFTLTHFRLEFNILKVNGITLRCTVQPNKRFDATMFNFNPEWAYSGIAEYRKRPIKHEIISLDGKIGNNETLFLFFNSRLLKGARALVPELDDNIEFLVAEDSNATPARSYYSSRTTMLKKQLSEEREESSDDEREWLIDHQRLYLSEFTDVNEGEKNFMAVWNAHVAKCDYQEDRCFAHLCLRFVYEQVEKLVNSNLVNNFLLHLANCTEYGMLTRLELVRTVDYFNLRKLEVFNK